eukprot:scpid87601/ scgid21836/ Lysozyme 1; 1,4-beta-N-acetylmuramidase 1; cv-lysozyme 1
MMAVFRYLPVAFFFVIMPMTSSECRGLEIPETFFRALRHVESTGDDNAVGDDGASQGPLQIKRAYYNDAVVSDPSLTGNGMSYDDVKGQGSYAYSKRVVQSYMDHYATSERLGRQPTLEDIARIHNGGPTGYKRDSTLGYWQKVNGQMQLELSSARPLECTLVLTLGCTWVALLYGWTHV